MSEPSISPAHEPTPENDRWSGRWGIADYIITVVVLVSLFLTILNECGIGTESWTTAIIMYLLAGIGLFVGGMATKARKAGDWKTAMSAYRVAMWCFFLAFNLALKYHAQKEQEATIKRHEEEIEELKKASQRN